MRNHMTTAHINRDEIKYFNKWHGIKAAAQKKTEFAWETKKKMRNLCEQVTASVRKTEILILTPENAFSNDAGKEV